MQRIIFILAAALFLSCGQAKSKEQQDPTNTITVQNSTDSIQPTTMPPGSSEGSDESAVNALLKEQMGGKWRVITDKDAFERSDYYTVDVKKERLKNPNFPFIAKGDFNGDSKPDFAALITNEEQEFGHLLARVCILPAGGKYIRDDEETGTWPSYQLLMVKRSTTIGIYNDNENPDKLVLKSDGIEVLMGETGAYYITWNGKEFKTYTFYEE